MPRQRELAECAWPRWDEPVADCHRINAGQSFDAFHRRVRRNTRARERAAEALPV